MVKRNNGQNRKARREKDEEEEVRRDPEGLHGETKRGILAILLFVAAILFALSYIGKGGRVGYAIFQLFDFLLGQGYFFAPLTLLLVGYTIFRLREKQIVATTILGGSLFLLVILAGFHLLVGARTGGFLGQILGATLVKLFDLWASLVILTALVVISILILFNVPLRRAPRAEEADGTENQETPVVQTDGTIGGEPSALEKVNHSVQEVLEKAARAAGSLATPAAQSSAERAREESGLALRKVARKFNYQKPPLELLQGDQGKPQSGDIKANANIIKRTLENFGIDVEMGEVAIGPTVTQYTLRPAEGVKLSRITALSNDLSLALAAHPLRIEAPIPGKPLVGIEVPNRSIAQVGLRSLLETKTFQETGQPLLFALGRDVAGLPVFADLARMPHLLVSGATGAGKSVAIHSLISSFLYRNPPQILRFILVDPKRVELSVYNDIPHLLTPVITDSKKTIQALRWATREMDRRYDLLSTAKARDIASYNVALSKSSEADSELLAYLVIIIDELADLMAVFPREVESSIIRLAQMARAVGIHLIVATQRPSVEVITGLIKANITSRIALQVASQVDSRTILDIAGAEKLLGNGDMLFLAGDTAKPRRIQGAYISEAEVKRVVDFLREEFEAPEYEEAILETTLGEGEEGGELGAEGLEDGEDPLYEEAREVVVAAGKASASYLQRRLRVGYARAARLLDLMESRGVIGPADGAKPREIRVKSGASSVGSNILES